jgi:hypothetical protein
MKNTQFKKIIAATAYLIFSISFFACSEIKDGYSDIDNWPEVKDYTSKLTHPCMLHTESDFAFVKDKVSAGIQPWANAFAHLESSKHAQSSWTANPVKLLARLDYNNWHEKYPNDYSNYTNLMYDAASAYQLALRWKISGDEQFAKAAVLILNSWASTCTGYIVDSNRNFIDPNEYLIAIQIYQLANAAEILRTYKGWTSAEFSKYKTWMVDVFYSQASKFLSLHNGVTCPLHYWLNWDLAQMTAVLSIGILTDDNYKINEAIQYFKFGIGSGNIENAVPFVHKDPDSDETLGQCQESGRDQGHATLCVSLIGVFSQMAKNIGEDVFTYDNNRVLSMCEYVGKYNYGETETGSVSNSWTLSNFKYDISKLPYSMYENCTGNSWPSMSYEEHKNNNDTRGSVRPSWELIHRLAADYNLSNIYTEMWVNKMRENATRGYSDGGAPDYGHNSGGYDQLGWGTLMFAK